VRDVLRNPVLGGEAVRARYARPRVIVGRVAYINHNIDGDRVVLILAH